MKYFVIHDGGPVPRALVRTDHHGEEQLVGLGEWAASDLLGRSGWTVAEVEGYEFYGHVYEAMRVARAGLPCVAVLGVTYRADEFINVDAIMRRRNGVEEWLDRENVWRAEHRDLGGRFWLPVSEEELDRLQWTVTRPEWFVVRRWDGQPHALVRRIPSAEEAFGRDLRWQRSDLRARAEKLDNSFDARDVRAAIEIGVRAERYHVRGGTHYFALWPTVEFDPKDLHSVIRRSAAGEEIHVGHRGWVPSGVVGGIERGGFSFYRPLPVSEEEAEAVIARQVAPRSFLVLNEEDGRDLPVAVVRVHGEREEAFTRDLVWGPSELLAELPDGLRVEELPRGANGVHEAYWLAAKLRVRRRAMWECEYWYYAIFADEAKAIDLANAHTLVRTDAGGDFNEQTYRDGEWKYSRVLGDIRRCKSDDEHLPISPEEAKSLMERL
ncbi:hypothetical protein [Lentzea kentuckyensis]|uniref:hypothetical protein n=1 Tax=Lentzea kentuckyensis TaxID=360086 RepID=UPI000A3AA667|nr:hypothetical protein [Lentzea kentuckyensis]